MTIKKRLAIYLFFPFIILTGILTWLASDLVHRGFNEVEQTEAHEDFDRLKELTTSEAKFMSDQANNWGAWDDTYDWIINRNPAYLTKNYDVATVFDLHFDFAIIADLKGQILVGFKYDEKNQKISNVTKDDSATIKKVILDKIKNQNADSFVGVVPVQNDAWFFASRKVTNSKMTKKPNGHLIFIRSALSNVIPRFNDIIKFKISYNSYPASAPQPKEGISIASKSELLMTLKLPIQYGDQIGYFSFKKDRKIFETGENVFWQLIIGMTCLIVLIGAVVYIAVSVSIIEKLKILGQRIAAIQKSEHLNERIEVSNEDEIADLGLAMNKMLDRIAKDQIEINRAARMNSLNQLASGVAHEVNNPLNIILGSASLMTRKIDILTGGNAISTEQIIRELEDMKKFSAKIKTTAVRIAHIVQSLRSLAKEDFYEESQITNPQQIVDVINSLCEARMKENEIAFEVEYQSADLRFMSRPLHLNKVMLILISNCFDAIANQEEKWIKLKFKETKSSVQIEISDSGTGVLPEDRDKLFTPFFSTKPTGTGTGLGLSVAKGLIESQNGNIYFDKTQQHTTFVVELQKIEPVAASA